MSITEAQRFIKNKIIKEIKCFEGGRAVGPDEIPIEILKLIADEHLKLSEELFNNIFDSGEIRNRILISTFIQIPKKENTLKCEEYRIISLMDHILKIFLGIIYERTIWIIG